MKLFLLAIFSLLPFTSWSFEALLEPIDALLENRKGIVIVSIGGCPGVGKSTFSKILQCRLEEKGISTIIISLDHFGLSQEERKAFTSEFDMRRIRWGLIHEMFHSIEEGTLEIRKPIINQLTKEISEEIIDLRGVQCILFEGSYTLNDFLPCDYRSYADLAIYLETAVENLFSWKWEREFKKTNPRTEKTFFLHMKAVLEDFAVNVYPGKNLADFIVDIDSFHNYTIQKREKEVLIPDFRFSERSH